MGWATTENLYYNDKGMHVSFTDHLCIPVSKMSLESFHSISGKPWQRSERSQVEPVGESPLVLGLGVWTAKNALQAPVWIPT